MALNPRIPRRPLESRGLDFFDEVPMIVTSSPIERDNVDSRAVKVSESECDLPWGSVLQEYYFTPENRTSGSDETIDLYRQTSSETSSNLDPIVEQRFKIAVEDHKIKLLSHSKKILDKKKEPTKGTTLHKKSSVQHEEEKLDKIREKLRSRDLAMDEILKYEDYLRQTVGMTESAPEREKGDPIGVIETELGNLNVTPKTSRLLEKRRKEQEKRLISLISSKKKAAANSKQALDKHLQITEEKIKRREELELRQIRAEKLRQKALASATVFPSLHGAHHKAVTKRMHQGKKTTELQKHMQRELAKAQSQTNQMVKDIFATLQKEQYAQLREQVQDQKQKDKELIRESQAQLERFKSSYDEKLKELKEIASSKTTESREERKEVTREISRIQKDLRQHFEKEFNGLLEKIEASGNDRREMRAEKGSKLVEKILKADFVFDL